MILRFQTFDELGVVRIGLLHDGDESCNSRDFAAAVVEEGFVSDFHVAHEVPGLKANSITMYATGEP